MEKDTKTIAISKETWLRLINAKYNYSFDSFDSLIKWLLSSYEVKVNKEE